MIFAFEAARLRRKKATRQLRRFHWSCKTWKACPNSKVMSDEWLINCCKHWDLDLARRQFESPVLNLEATFFPAGGSVIFDFPGYALDDDPDEQTYWIILDGLKLPQQHWSFRWPWLTRPTFWECSRLWREAGAFQTTWHWLNFSKSDVWTDDHDRCGWVETVYPKQFD